MNRSLCHAIFLSPELIHSKYPFLLDENLVSHFPCDCYSGKYLHVCFQHFLQVPLAVHQFILIVHHSLLVVSQVLHHHPLFADHRCRT